MVAYPNGIKILVLNMVDAVTSNGERYIVCPRDAKNDRND